MIPRLMVFDLIRRFFLRDRIATFYGLVYCVNKDNLSNNTGYIPAEFDTGGTRPWSS